MVLGVRYAVVMVLMAYSVRKKSDRKKERICVFERGREREKQEQHANIKKTG